MPRMGPEEVLGILERVEEEGYPAIAVRLDDEELSEERVAELLSSRVVRGAYILKGIICGGGDVCSEFSCELSDCSAAEEMAELLARSDTILIIIDYGDPGKCSSKTDIVVVEVEGDRDEAIERLVEELRRKRGVISAVRRDEDVGGIMWFIKSSYEGYCMRR